LFARKQKTKFLMLSDMVTAFAPVGIFLVRIGNFINGELYGRVASVGLCLRFPAEPINWRYPSQLFEAVLEGLVLFVVLWVIRKKYRHLKPGVLSGAFLIFYGLFRIICEFFREPDAQIGFLIGNATEGQILSALMMIAGAVVWFWVGKKKQ